MADDPGCSRWLDADLGLISGEAVAAVEEGAVLVLVLGAEIPGEVVNSVIATQRIAKQIS